ncbi:MAG: hypothetical protein ABJP34_07830 [Erythrobacter sp.]
MEYSHLLARSKDWDGSIELLNQMVEADIKPGYFWLAWRLDQRGGAQTDYGRIERLLVASDEAGNPAAHIYLSRFYAMGKMGLHKIPKGLWGFASVLKKLTVNGLE